MKLNFLIPTLGLLFSVLSLNLFAEKKAISIPNQQTLLASLFEAINNKDLSEVDAQITLIKKQHPQLLNEEYLGETPLSKSSKQGNLAIVNRLITAGVDVDKAPASTITPLMKAAYYGHLEVVNQLLSAGANIRLEHQGGYEAFDWALENNKNQVMVRLINQLLRIESAKDGEQANLDEAWLAISEEKLDPATLKQLALPSKQLQSLILIKTILADDAITLSTLLQKKFNPDHHNVTGYAALPLAVRLNKLTMIDTLIQSGANVNIGNNGDDEASPINQAARAGNVKLLKLLVAAGADVNKPNARGYTALHLAVGRQSLESVQYLLASGANPNALMRDGLSPFDFAYQTGNKAIITEFLLADMPSKLKKRALASINAKQYLVESKSLPHSGFLAAAIINDLPLSQFQWLKSTKQLPAAFGYFPLSYAARFGNLELVILLLERGAQVNQKSKAGYQTTALSDAVRQAAHLEVIKHLLDHHADIKATDKNGDPAINWATLYGHLEAVRYLLSRGADPLQANKDDYTALRTAKERGHKKIIELIQSFLEQRKSADQLAILIKEKSFAQAQDTLPKLKNLNIYLSDGSSLLLEAIKHAKMDWVEWLLTQGADANQTNISGYFSTPLMQSVNHNLPRLIDLLVKAGANLDDTDVLGDPAINWAAYLGKADVVNRLIEQGANVKIKTVHGNALDIAMRQGHSRIIDMLLPQFNKQPQSTWVTNLFASVARKDFVTLKRLLKESSKEAIYDGYGNSILPFAASKRCIACVEILIQAGQPVDQTDRIGFSALMIAARNGDLSLLELLLKHQANVNQHANSNGMMATPLILAAAHNQTEVIKKLYSAGAKLDVTDVMGNTALHWTLGAPNNSTTDLLISLGANTEITNQYGISAKSVIENI